MTVNSSKYGLLKKAFYIWAVQYHFVIPKKILDTYIHKYMHERENIKKYGRRFFDPSDREQYSQWLGFRDVKNTASSSEKPVLIDIHNGVFSLKDIKTKYVCLKDEHISLYPEYETCMHIEENDDVIYFDHDHLDEEGRFDPVLKPDYSYDTLRGFNYIGNCFVVRTDLLRQFEGKSFNVYRILLELSDQHVRFRHISEILYGDNRKEEFDNQTVPAYFAEHQIQADITEVNQSLSIYYPVKGKPLVSIVIPTKDAVSVLDVCIQSVLRRSTYQNFEILIADNNSSEEKSFRYFSDIQKKDKRIHVVRVQTPFNFSLINNRMIFEHAKGDYVVMLNNDTEVITPDWLEKMLSYAQMDHVGSVGAKLYYEDGTIQHGGVISGKGGGFAHRYYRKPHDEKGYMHTLDVPNDVFGCTAACLMIPMSKYKEVGGMNEELAVQFNDVDLCLKLLKKGYHNVFLPDVELFHYESKSRGIDKKQSAVDRYFDEVEYAQEHYHDYLVHDPYYNDAFDKNYDYMLIAGTGSN